MCLICKDLIALKMTMIEAESNAREARTEDGHSSDLYEALDQMDLELLEDVLTQGEKK